MESEQHKHIIASAADFDTVSIATAVMGRSSLTHTHARAHTWRKLSHSLIALTRKQTRLPSWSVRSAKLIGAWTANADGFVAIWGQPPAAHVFNLTGFGSLILIFYSHANEEFQVCWSKELIILISPSFSKSPIKQQEPKQKIVRLKGAL